MLRPRSIGLLLAFITLLVFIPATSNQFINFDDPDYVIENHVVQNGLTWAGVKWAFTGVHASNWHPLTWLSHMVDCDLFRLNPGGPHLVNILFHSVNAALLFALLFRLTKNLWPSVFITALFAWHPLHVESVAWIAERKDVLSTFFTLLTLQSYVRYVQENHRRNFWFAVCFFMLALLSKPMPVTLPLVMLLLDYWPLKRTEIDRLPLVDSVPDQSATINDRLSMVFEKWPFILLSAASCVITFLSQRDTAVSSLAHVPLSFRLENMLVAYAGYLWKMVCPLDLAILYPLHAPIAWHLVAESVIILTGISLIVWRERKFSPWLIIGWLWFLVTLLPVIGLVQVGGQSMADRYTYFPLIGIFLALTFSIQALVRRFGFLGKWLALVAVLILGVCVALTENQLRYWRNSETLFTHAVIVADSAAARISLGTALRDQGRISEALTQYIRALKLDPDSTLIWSDIGWIFDEEGHFGLAAGYYQEAVKRNPTAADVYDNYGLVLVKLGRLDEAMGQFSAAARRDAGIAQPHYLMGWLRLQQGLDVEAISHLHKALQLEPDNFEALILTASVLAADEDPQVRNGMEARVLAEKIVKLTNGQQFAALDTLSMSYAETGDFGEAMLSEQQAIKLAEVSGQTDNLDSLQKRLDSYKKHQPWRDSFKKK